MDDPHPLPHAAEIAAIDAQVREGVETHLRDVRRLVADDTPGVIEELRRLRNTPDRLLVTGVVER